MWEDIGFISFTGFEKKLSDGPHNLYEFKWTKVSAVLGLQFGESFKTVACTVDFVGIFKVFKFKR